MHPTLIGQRSSLLSKAFQATNNGPPQKRFVFWIRYLYLLLSLQLVSCVLRFVKVSLTVKVSYLLIFLKQSCGQKRPLHVLKESSSKLLHSKSLDLNVPAGENDAGNKDGCSCCVAQAQDGPVGTYYTTCINW